MAIPFLTPSRCVLLVGDEALCVYDVTFGAARLLGALPWQSPDFEDSAAALIRQTKGKGVLILNDMTDQHFKGGQRLPKVGPMDKAMVMERRLQVAFPNYPIRGALQMKQPKGATAPEATAAGKNVSAGLYLFAAVPMSEPIIKTMEAVRRSLASVAGFALLPVEAADMVRSLSEKLAGKKRRPSRWVVFIGQHHNGALRQVIIRDGQLAMTRMTPVSDAAGDHGQWALEVAQEFKATVSYLSRFGFTPEDGTDVIAVCTPAAGQVLEGLIDIPCHFTTFTAAEAARELGMNIGRQDDPRYVDPLHAAWAGRKQRLTLPMKAPELEKVNQPRQIAALAMFLLILGVGYLAWQALIQSQAMMTLREDIGTQRQNLARAQADYQGELDRMAALGFDVKLVQGSIRLYKELEDRRLKTLTLVKTIDDQLGPELRLDALTLDYLDNKGTEQNPYAYNPDPAAADASAPPVLDVSLKLSFPPTIDPQAGVDEVNSLRRRLAEHMKDQMTEGFAVVVRKNIVGREYADSVSGVAGRDANEIASEQYTAEINIKGSFRR